MIHKWCDEEKEKTKLCIRVDSCGKRQLAEDFCANLTDLQACEFYKAKLVPENYLVLVWYYTNRPDDFEIGQLS